MKEARNRLALVYLAFGICLGLVGGFVFKDRLNNSSTHPDTIEAKIPKAPKPETSAYDVRKVLEAPKFARKLLPTIEEMITPEEVEKRAKEYKERIKTPAEIEQEKDPNRFKWFKTEKEIIQWARGGSMYRVQTYRYQRPNKQIVAVLKDWESPDIYFFVHDLDPEQPDGGDTGWTLKLYRHGSSEEVSLWVGQNPDELYFRSKSGRVLLSVDLTSLDYVP